MMQMATAPEARLREEDLEVGKPFVHPDTKLEYEDFHAYLCGKDPLPHWRNARIKEIHEAERNHCNLHAYARWYDGISRDEKPFAEFLAERFAFFCRCYSRHGDPLRAVRVDEFGLALAER